MAAAAAAAAAAAISLHILLLHIPLAIPCCAPLLENLAIWCKIRPALANCRPPSRSASA